MANGSENSCGLVARMLQLLLAGYCLPSDERRRLEQALPNCCAGVPATGNLLPFVMLPSKQPDAGNEDTP